MEKQVADLKRIVAEQQQAKPYLVELADEKVLAPWTGMAGPDGAESVGTMDRNTQMSITAAFVPVESTYERKVSDLLVDQGRSFTEPLRYNASSYQLLPDFILTNTAKGSAYGGLRSR